MVLPNIEMNPPQVYMCSPCWTLLPPPSPYHPSGSSQCTSSVVGIFYRRWGFSSYLLPFLSHTHTISTTTDMYANLVLRSSQCNHNSFLFRSVLSLCIVRTMATLFIVEPRLCIEYYPYFSFLAHFLVFPKAMIFFFAYFLVYFSPISPSVV